VGVFIDRATRGYFCLRGGGGRDGPTATAGVVIVPPGCAAHTDEWVLPASLTREVTARVQSFAHDLSALNVTINPVGIDPTSTQPETRGAVEGRTDVPTQNINGRLSVIKARNDVALRWEAELINEANAEEKFRAHGSRYPAEASVLGGVAIAIVMGCCIAFYVKIWPRYSALVQRVELLRQRLDLHEQKYNVGVRLQSQDEAIDQPRQERGIEF
jgi:hypothetical protein